MTSEQKITCPDCAHGNIPGADNCESCHSSLETLTLPQADSELLRRILEGTIADLQPRAPICVGPETPIAEVVGLMRKNKRGGALIMQDGELIGLMTERDLVFAVAGLRDPKNTLVHEIMHKAPPCLEHDEPISHAFHHMTVGNYRHLPLKTAEGGFAMISSRDLLRYLTL